jgi:hypothetical protein
MDDLTKFRWPIVKLDDGIIGVIIHYGAHVSTVAYSEGGHGFEIIVPNEDFEILDYISFRYEEI